MTADLPLLSVRNLSVEFRTRLGTVHVLDGVSFDIARGEIVGIIGESGSGKSVTAFSVMGILDASAKIRSGGIFFEGRDVLAMPRREKELWRGAEASIIFQSPRTALNPIRAVGAQIADVLGRHRPANAQTIQALTYEALRQVRIPDPIGRAKAYPFELSGGMCQRIGIAMALACEPRLLIADEPTTGLDVTTQAVIMDLIRELSRARNLGVVLITHDLALAAEYCDRIVIMHAGHVVEVASVRDLFAAPHHPYTARLLRSVPSLVDDISELQAIEGGLPDLGRTDLPACRFAERCDRRQPECDQSGLTLMAVPGGVSDHLVACRHPL